MTTNFPALLTQHGNEIAKALPKHLSPERMIRIALTAFRLNKSLAQCDPLSVYAAVIQASQLGLEVGGPMGEASLVPFKSECQLVIGYQGLMKLARNSGQVLDIYAYPVRERDTFSVHFGTERSLKHIPLMKNGFVASDAERGQITGFYAVAKLKNGTDAFAVLSRADVEEIRNSSQNYKYKGNKSIWGQHFAAMGMKSAIIRLCRFLPRSSDLTTAIALDSTADNGQSQKLQIEAASNGEYSESLYASREDDEETELLPTPLTQEGEALVGKIISATSQDELDSLRLDVARYSGTDRDRVKAAFKDSLESIGNDTIPENYVSNGQ